MPLSFNKIWIHAIWSTKERQPPISNSVENKIYNFLHEEFIALGCPVRIIDGMPDHLHAFIHNPFPLTYSQIETTIDHLTV